MRTTTIKRAKPRSKISDGRGSSKDVKKTVSPSRGHSFPVVAIGASGEAAFATLLRALPSKSGMAFVLIQCSGLKDEGALAARLLKATSMSIVEVSDGIAAEPDHVYVIPPNKNMTLRQATFRLAPRSRSSGLKHPIDRFMIAVAEEEGKWAVGVVLSGTGSDGTLGIQAIKAAGGATFAQDPKTAERPAMPTSAIATGGVDYVLRPKRMAAELVRIGRPYLTGGREVPQGSAVDFEVLPASAREPIRALIAAYQSAQEDLKAANGEAQSGIDKLKITNQELELAREELRSSNEELATVNDELRHHNEELDVLTHDLTNLLVGVDIPVLILDAHLRIRRFTPVAGTLLNLIHADVGRPFSDIDPNLTVANWNELLLEVTLRGRFIEREASSRDGHRYSMRMRPYKMNTTDKEGVLVVLLNAEMISRARDQAPESRDMARAELGMIESTARALLEASPQSIIGVSVDNKIALVNGTTGEMFGHHPGELIGPPFEIVVPENARESDAERAEFANLQSRSAGSGLALEGRRKDGTLFPVEIGRSVIETPTGKLGVKFVSDSIQQKRMEQAAEANLREIRDSEERFRTMADAAPVMIWVTGPDKLCTFFNQGWLTFTGSTLDESLNDCWLTKLHPDDRDHCFANYSSAFDARRSYQREYRLRRADGEYRWALATGTPRFEPGGELAGYVGTLLDITDLKQAHAQHLIKEKMETIGTLARGIAHDFNNLLAGVLGQSELALTKLASASSPADELQRIREAAMRGAEIVQQLMVYAGEETEALELVSISAIVKDMLELLKLSVSKHVRVEAELRKDLPAIRAMPAQIRQIVMNLFSNASEAIGEHDGAIRVRTSLAQLGSHSSLATSERLTSRDHIQIEISDTGRGMTPEVQAKIFEPFFTTKTTGNHGHGLPLVKGIVDRLEGTIQILGAPGEGTTVQILLPCEPIPLLEASRAMKMSLKDEPGSRQTTVLYVEDDHPLRDAVSQMLRKEDLSVIEVNDGTAALDVIRSYGDCIDVLLLDVTLPDASSSNIYDEAKRLNPRLPVIVTSAKSKEMAAASLATEIEDFLQKPFRLGDLMQRIHLASGARARGATTAS